MVHNFVKIAGAIPHVAVGNCNYNTRQIINLIKQAEERYGKIAKGGIPENIKEVNLSSESSEFKLCDILVKVGFASSKSEARRMIQGNGVKVNSEVVNDINATIEIKGDVVIQFGKNKFIKVV